MSIPDDIGKVRLREKYDSVNESENEELSVQVLEGQGIVDHKALQLTIVDICNLKNQEYSTMEFTNKLHFKHQYYADTFFLSHLSEFS
jgi:hypothetical protein